MAIKLIKRTGFLLLAASVIAAGCSGDTTDNDAGVADTGTPRDTGASIDSGRIDTGVRDTGVTDRGVTDTGVTDTGMTDTGVRQLVSIASAPAALTLDVGATQTLIITGTYDDNSTADLTSMAGFASSDDTIASVDAAGVVSGVAEGTATITVDVSGTMTTVDATVAAVAANLLVFDDDFAGGITFLEFGGSTNDVAVDTTVFNTGAASLKIEVPAAGYTGGAMQIDTPQDLSQFDALTFWARASVDLVLNVTGIGNNAVSTTYQSELNAVALTSTWTRFVIPIPNAARLTAEDGLFHFAEGSEDGAYTIWLDDVQYETLGSAVLGAAQPAIATETVTPEIGGTFLVNGTSATFDVSGTAVTVSAARPYFDFTSSDAAVVTVNADGQGTAVAAGTANVTATLAGIAAAGSITVNVTAANVPAAPAPTPAVPMANVISLFSNAYTNVPVDTFSAVWDNADVADAVVGTDDVKLYTNLVFAGLEFVGPNSINAAAMTHFHMDIWTPNSTVFRVKLVDFGADNGFGGGDDTEHELTFDAASTPALVTGSWLSLEIPLSDFVGLTTRSNLSQMILVGSTSTVFVDNVYLHN